MSAIRFQTTTEGNLPHLSYILCNPEPLGTEFKTVACSITGALISLEVHRIKEYTKKGNYSLNIGETASFTNIITEAKNRIGQRYIKGVTNDCFLFYSWF